MKTYEIVSKVSVYTMSELPEADRQLVEAAMEATATSYAPYSLFKVGAAARLANGTVCRGSNQENASYPLALCAERTCLFAANANHPDQPVVALAIAARNAQNEFLTQPIPPCGACRQVILEVEDRYKQPIRILLYGTEGVHVVDTIKTLLPLQFVADNMK